MIPVSRPHARVRAAAATCAVAAALTVGLPFAAPVADAAPAAPSAPAVVKHPCGLTWTTPALTAWGLFPRKKTYYVFSKPSTGSKKIFKVVDPAKDGTSGVLVGFDSTYTHKPGWFKVVVPDRSNKKVGWARQIDLAGYKITQALEINTESHKMAFIKGSQCVRVFPVAVGKSSTPTPHGYFFINDRLPAPNAAYGHHILGTSAYSPAFVTFGGLDAAIGIHGTNEDSSVGHPVSHGCVRMHIGDSDWLYPKIKLGTPVYIT